MQVLIRVEDGDPDVVRSLGKWLRDGEGASGYRGMLSVIDDTPGHMGLAIDVFAWVLGTGLSTGQLLFSIAEWRKTRHPAPTVLIERPNGVTIQISSSDADALAEAARKLEAT